MSTTSEETTGLRTRALTARPKRRDVRSFYRRFAKEFASVRDPRARSRKIIIGVGAFVVPIGLLAMATGIEQTLDEGGPDMVTDVVVLSIFAAALVFAGGVSVWWTYRTRRRRGTPQRHYRLATFASDNGMRYYPGPMRGSHVTPWVDRGTLILSRVMRPVSRRPVEFANYELVYGNEKNTNTQFGGYCAIRLSTSLPHILLQAKQDHTVLSNASVLASAQRRSLEGDFDTHFTLYCPAGYERDALYLFTPDVMARLIDHVSGFDVEIIDDWLFLVSRRDVVTLDPGVWRELLAATGALGDKIARWERWRDDRLAGRDETIGSGVAPVPSAGQPPVQFDPAATPTGVARPGRRLRTSIAKSAIIPALVVALLLGGVIITNLWR